MCLAAAFHALQQSCVLIRSHKNRKENENAENLASVVAAALRPCEIEEALEGGPSIKYPFNYFEKYPISLK